MSVINHKQWNLASYVGAGKELAASNFKQVTVKLDPATLTDGQVILKNLYLSVDASLKLHLDPTASMTPPSPLDQPLMAVGIGKVVTSKNDKFKEGDVLVGYGLIWAEYSVVNPELFGLQKVVANYPLYYYLGLLGYSGITAYYGLLELADPKANEIVVVSTAAGAVGYVVGQLAKLRGCKVIGITGSETKCKVLTTQLQFDAVINYKTSSNINYYLIQHSENPKIDVYFDNVGGETLNAVLALLNTHARVLMCGATSTYNSVGTPEQYYPITNLGQLTLTKSRVIGFIVGDYFASFPKAVDVMEGWLKEGKLKSLDDVVSGIDQLPGAAVGMMRGDNIGKRTVKIADN